MNKSILLLLFLCINSFLFSQELSPRIQIKAGIADPLGNFGSDRLSTKSGFARNGRNLGVKFFVPISKTLDLSIGYSNNVFSIDRQRFDRYQEQLIKQQIDPNLITEEFNLTTTYNSYSNNNLFAGIKINFPINQTVNFYINPSLTYSWLKIPDIGIVVRDSSLEFGASQTSNPTQKFALSFSGGLSKEVSEKLKLFMDLTYLKSRHKSKIKVSGVNINGDRYFTDIVSNDDFIATIYSVGLIYKISKE